MKLCGPRRDEAARGKRKLHNKELLNLYSSPHIFYNNEIKEDEINMTCSTHTTEIYTMLLYKNLKRPLRALKHR
jgi:hypothetical protein